MPHPVMEHAWRSSLRRSAYAILIALAAGQVAGRILSAEYVLEPSLHRPADLVTDPRRPWPTTPPPALRYLVLMIARAGRRFALSSNMVATVSVTDMNIRLWAS
jgi:hypothetical protein